MEIEGNPGRGNANFAGRREDEPRTTATVASYFDRDCPGTNFTVKWKRCTTSGVVNRNDAGRLVRGGGASFSPNAPNVIRGGELIGTNHLQRNVTFGRPLTSAVDDLLFPRPNSLSSLYSLNRRGSEYDRLDDCRSVDVVQWAPVVGKTNRFS